MTLKNKPSHPLYYHQETISKFLKGFHINTADFTSIDKETLLSLYKNEDLCMEENELQDHIIQQGKAQSAELSEDITSQMANDFNILKKTNFR